MSGCSCSIAECTLVSSARAASSVASGASRPNRSVMRCRRSVFIVAPRWCGLVTMFAMIWVSVGYGTEGSRTPTTVAAVEPPRRTAWPMTDGSLLSTSFQKRCVSTTAPAAPSPSSAGVSSRPSTGRSPITSKNDPLTTPALTRRGSLPKPTNVKSTVEKSPNAATVLARDLKSSISGTEKVRFWIARPCAAWRM